MSACNMDSDMQKFFKNKTIFLTGGSGFLGKVIIEKLLRSADVKRIYVLIRPKRGQDVQDRIAAWKGDAVFGLIKSDAERLDRILPISGDCQEPDLGISEVDRQLLRDEVQVVLHGAATVRFVEPLHLALAINTRATRLLVQLAKEMNLLEAFVHVSTAFSNCVIHNIDECFYPEHLSCSVDKVLALHEQLSNELMDNMTPALVGRFPNTYTYTKALAEQVLQTEAGDLPLCISRPGVITGSYKEPVDGWIDNLYGPLAILYGAAYGILRITRLNINAEAPILPVDYCANMVLASAWHTAQTHASRRAEMAVREPPIYNYVPDERNKLSWGGFRQQAETLGNVYPLTKMMWWPFLQCTTIPWLFKFLAFFYHILPGHAIDLVLRLRGDQPRMIKMYEKIHKNIEILSPFVDHSWYFKTHNTKQLWQCLSLQDQKLFPFDMASLDWHDYFDRALSGMRVHLAKEELSVESIRKGQRVRARFYILHRLLQFVLCSGAAAILYSLVNFIVRF